MHASDGTVTNTVNTLTCAMEIYTIDAGALPGTKWFAQSIGTKVDGGSSVNTASKY